MDVFQSVHTCVTLVALVALSSHARTLEFHPARSLLNCWKIINWIMKGFIFRFPVSSGTFPDVHWGTNVQWRWGCYWLFHTCCFKTLCCLKEFVFLHFCKVYVAVCICNLATRAWIYRTMWVRTCMGSDGDSFGVVWLSGVNSVAQMGALNIIRTSIAGPSLITVQ